MFAGVFIIVIFAVIIGVAIGLVPYILYLVMISRTLKQCAPHNQRMTPGEVWLVLIPLFGIVWHFILVGRLADSIAAEFRQRNLRCEEERPGYNYGLWSMILRCCGIIPFLGIFASLTGIVFWIMHWVRIAGYKRALEQSQFQYGSNPYGFQYQYQHYQQYPQYPQHPQYPNYPQQAQFPGRSDGSNEIHF